MWSKLKPYRPASAFWMLRSVGIAHMLGSQYAVLTHVCVPRKRLEASSRPFVTGPNMRSDYWREVQVFNSFNHWILTVGCCFQWLQRLQLLSDALLPHSSSYWVLFVFQYPRIGVGGVLLCVVPLIFPSFFLPLCSLNVLVDASWDAAYFMRTPSAKEVGWLRIFSF